MESSDKLTLVAGVTYTQAMKHISLKFTDFEALMRCIGAPQIPNAFTLRGKWLSYRRYIASVYCFAISVSDERVVLAKIAFSGMSRVPAGAKVTELALIGKAYRLETCGGSSMELGRDFIPTADLRTSAQCRLQVAKYTLLDGILRNPAG